MRSHATATVHVLSVALVFTFCGIPEAARAWALPQGAYPDAPSAIAPNPIAQAAVGQNLIAQNQVAQNPVAQINDPDSAAPSQAPGPAEVTSDPALVPEPATQSQPTEETPAQPPSSTDAQPAVPNNSPRTNVQAPAGAAGAQRGQTAGSVASRPAGSAMAPAKQRQVRSVLIKLGAIAAAGAAVGTVYALTRGTSSVPPGSGR
ncbi:MAG TPA: hypothetical protein VG892_13225 [Terriglobales bacterium]|jgi:hypothetical protein|nr:hypothetical protein [Terriglobales bacterium]